MTSTVPVALDGPAQTMLTTLYLKALDADFAHPVLGDRFAKDAVARLDYDWDRIGISGRWAPLITVRTAQFDAWARQFLTRHQQATVLHIGCGLDSRVFRLAPGSGVHWYDVDYPEVIALRERIYPSRAGYRLIAASATDPSWLDRVPDQHPVLLIAEGISMYLTRSEGLGLLRHIVDRFPSGELHIDFFNRLAIASQRVQILVRRSHSTLHWAVDEAADIVGSVPGTRVLTAVPIFDAATFGQAPAAFQLARRLVAAAPPLRNAVQYHRYEFGRDTRAVLGAGADGSIQEVLMSEMSGARRPRVLLVYYSYTGQSRKVLEAAGEVFTERGYDVQTARIELTDRRYAERFSRFPMNHVWPDMLSVLPAQMRRATAEIGIPAEALEGGYDLICFGSPTWWRTTSLPLRSFLKSAAARNLLADTPFVTFVVCRRYWRDNIRTVRKLAQRRGGRYLGGMHFEYPGGQVRSLLALTSYLRSGEYRQRYLGVRIPVTNVTPHQLDQARGFAIALADRLFGKPAPVPVSPAGPPR